MATLQVEAVVGSAEDARCVLYTSAVKTSHRYVKVLSGDAAAFARLRRQEGEAPGVSQGLLQALQLETPPVTLQVDTVAQDDVETNATSCKCRPGDVETVQVQFLDRSRPPSAVVRGLQRIAAKLLDGGVVWNSRRSTIGWLNRSDAVEFSGIVWDSEGSGCCRQLGIVSSSTKVELRFAGDEGPMRELRMATFKSVDEYVEQISSELGGAEKYARSLLQTILQRLGGEDETVKPSVGALVSGLPGVGKTALAKMICRSLGVKTVFLNAADIFQTYVGQSEKQLVKVFESAVLQSPSILLIDGIEAIAGSRRVLTDSQSALEIGVLGALLSSLEKIKMSTHRVFVLSTTSRPGDVDAAVLSNGRLDQVVSIEPPMQTERLETLKIMTKTWPLDELDDEFMYQVSESTGGFVGADLLSLCQKALQFCLNEAATTTAEGSAKVCPRHFEQALTVTYPSVLQTHHVSQKQQQAASTSIQRSGEGQSLRAFSGVVGMDDAIQTLRISMIEPLEDCSRFLRFGTTPPKGVLLTGPPGSGKTHLANAVAEDVRRRGLASFVSVQCSDLLTKVVGDTEKALRELFATARNAAPCVLYFDQIESIAPLRGFDTSTEQTFDRMLSMLLVEMDGFSTSRTKLQQSLASAEARMAFLKQHVVILASTTNKELLDPAILRPG
jgi:transitional endoplasmic reticulum ATPase